MDPSSYHVSLYMFKLLKILEERKKQGQPEIK